MNSDEIAKKLYLVQQQRRCLVVLDDIWSVDTWESLKAAFPLSEETKSRILLTTRNKEVAWHSDRNGFIHQPRSLSDDESWKLFEKIAIFGRNELNSGILTRMKEIGKKILQHCAGLPLAITVLAGLLARKGTMDEWEMVHKNVYGYIRRGRGHGKENTGALWVLRLSYDDLPYHLKLCFLYLGHFPEDFEIPVTRLTQLWMAEGLIYLAQERDGLIEAMEDVAYCYLNELVERCLVQIGERGSVRNIKSCRLHDLMRDLCLLHAEEENFLKIVHFSDQNSSMYPSSSSVVTNATPMSKVRRLAIYFNENVDKLVPSRNERDGRHLRSLLHFRTREWIPRNEKLVQSLFKEFKLLRVLKVQSIKTPVQLPNEIGNMVHLRFLSLRDSFIRERLPSSLGNLICLQTLDFEFGGNVRLPDVIWKLKELRHLYLPWNFSTPYTLQLSSLHNLQTLNHFSSQFCDLNDLTGLTNLRKLSIQLVCPSRSLDETLISSSSTLGGIRSLSVINILGVVDGDTEARKIVSSCRNTYKLILRCVNLPNDIHDYPNLTKLVWHRCVISQHAITMLEKLPSLRTLCLEHDQWVTSLVFSSGGFRNLKHLSMICLYKLQYFTMEEGAMPSLCRLHIERCIALRTFPDGLRYVTTLKELIIKDMSRKFQSLYHAGGLDYYKIQHIPSVIFVNP